MVHPGAFFDFNGEPASLDEKVNEQGARNLQLFLDVSDAAALFVFGRDGLHILVSLQDGIAVSLLALPCAGIMQGYASSERAIR